MGSYCWMVNTTGVAEMINISDAIQSVFEYV